MPTDPIFRWRVWFEDMGPSHADDDIKATFGNEAARRFVLFHASAMAPDTQRIVCAQIADPISPVDRFTVSKWLEPTYRVEAIEEPDAEEDPGDLLPVHKTEQARMQAVRDMPRAGAGSVPQVHDGRPVR